MAPNRVAGGMGQSSASNIFFTGDGPSQVVANSNLSSSIGNSSVIQSGSGCANLGTVVTGDISNTVLNSVVSSGPSVGASSLVTDANSALSGGPNLQRSASINNESYMRLPASPMSFSSNNISISGSSIVDGSSVIQPNQDPNSQPSGQNQQHQGASSATSLSSPGGGQGQFLNGSQLPGSLMQDPGYASQLQKKPRLDMKQEDILQKQVLQQYLQRQELAQLQNPNSQLQALIQQQRLRQQQQQQQHQQQMLQSLPPIQRAQLLQQQQQQQQQQQMQLRQQLQQQGGQPPSANKRPYDSGVCSRRLMQYLYHQRQRPPDNNIAYWRKFVAEYYSPRAKRRWCLSMYDNVGHHSLGVFPQAAMDAWQCDICGSKSGRGFEATFEVLPRLNEIKFGSGVIDELLFLDLPRECRFSSGIMMLEYVKAVQESVYEQLRVVREGQLRIIFAPDLKILSWEFCARRHEELLPRRLVSPQVNQLLQVAQKCQSTIAKSGADGVSQQDLQANSNMVVAAGRQLARSFELQSLNDLGFSKRYVRCLQISEVVNSMKDLMDFCRGSKVGPVEGLKNFPRHASTVKLQPQIKQEMDQLRGGIQHMPNDPNTISKLMAMHPGMGNPLGSNQPMEGRGALSGSAQAALALTNYQNMLSRQSSMNSRGSHQQEPSSPFTHPSPNPSSTSQGTSGGGSGSLQNSVVGGLSGPHMQQQQQQQRMALQGNQALQQQMMQHGNQAFQQQMMQQHSQATSGNSSGSGLQQQTHSVGGSLLRDGLVYGGHKTPAGAAASRSSSFKATSHRESSPAGGGTSSFNNQRSVELPQSHGNLHSAADDMGSDFPSEFPESAFLGSDLDDSMSFDWKS